MPSWTSPNDEDTSMEDEEEQSLPQEKPWKATDQQVRDTFASYLSVLEEATALGESDPMELRQKVFVLIAWFRGHRSEEFNSTHLFGDRGAQLFLAFCNSCPRGEMTKLMKDYVLQFLKDIGSTFEDFSAQVDALNAANATKFSKAYYLGFGRVSEIRDKMKQVLINMNMTEEQNNQPHPPLHTTNVTPSMAGAAAARFPTKPEPAPEPEHVATNIAAAPMNGNKFHFNFTKETPSIRTAQGGIDLSGAPGTKPAPVPDSPFSWSRAATNLTAPAAPVLQTPTQTEQTQASRSSLFDFDTPRRRGPPTGKSSRNRTTPIISRPRHQAAPPTATTATPVLSRKQAVLHFSNAERGAVVDDFDLASIVEAVEAAHEKWSTDKMLDQRGTLHPDRGKLCIKRVVERHLAESQKGELENLQLQLHLSSVQAHAAGAEVENTLKSEINNELSGQGVLHTSSEQIDQNIAVVKSVTAEHREKNQHECKEEIRQLQRRIDEITLEGEKRDEILVHNEKAQIATFERLQEDIANHSESMKEAAAARLTLPWALNKVEKRAFGLLFRVIENNDPRITSTESAAQEIQAEKVAFFKFLDLVEKKDMEALMDLFLKDNF
mmetsp:Transcript_30665/g.52453  ORF Transcript_30665/g.52453 Transcript_30665/m.52453 type:complete len:608 (-) Transcript_30665:287-2110(-)